MPAAFSLISRSNPRIAPSSAAKAINPNALQSPIASPYPFPEMT